MENSETVGLLPEIVLSVTCLKHYATEIFSIIPADDNEIENVPADWEAL